MKPTFTMSQIHCIGQLAQDELKRLSNQSNPGYKDWINEMKAIIKETDRLHDEELNEFQAFNYMIKRSLERSKEQQEAVN